MTRLSSSVTRFHKLGFPLVWFGGLAIFLAVAFLTGKVEQDLTFLLGPIAMAVFGYFVMRMVTLDLVDEVLDGGDFLLIRNKGQEERVALSNIMNVSTSNSSPARIILRLIVPSRFGPEIVFTPPVPSLTSLLSSGSLLKNPVAEDLMLRVHKARERRH